MEASVQAGVDQATQRFNESMDRIDRRVTVMTRLLVSTACTLLTTTVAAMFASIL
jgi:hypothetical protein